MKKSEVKVFVEDLYCEVDRFAETFTGKLENFCNEHGLENRAEPEKVLHELKLKLYAALELKELYKELIYHAEK